MKSVRIRNLVPFLLFLLLLVSCGKNDYPKFYAFDSFAVGEITGYTNTGKIKDQEVVDNFIEGKEDYFWQEDHQSGDWQIEIEFISESKARIYDDVTTMYFDVIRDNGVVYFQFEDTVSTFASVTNERLKFSHSI